jgi:hypothetical protein
MNIPTHRIFFTSVAPDGKTELRFASGLSCPFCGKPLRNFPVWGQTSHSFALICEDCHSDVLTFGAKS